MKMNFFYRLTMTLSFCNRKILKNVSSPVLNLLIQGRVMENVENIRIIAMFVWMIMVVDVFYFLFILLNMPFWQFMMVFVFFWQLHIKICSSNTTFINLLQD